MTQKRTHLAARATGHWPSLFLGILLATLLGYLALRPIISPDAWWHLSMGRATVEAGSATFADPVGASSVPEYVNIVWLFDVFLYLMHLLGGLVAVNLTVALLAVASFLVIWALARQEGGSAAPWTALGMAALAAGATHLRFVPRPQAAFLVLLPLTMLLAQRARLLHGRHSWTALGGLVVTVAIWAQMHASVVIAPVVAILASLVCCWSPRGGLVYRLPRYPQIATLAIVSLLPLSGPSGIDLVRRVLAHSDNYTVRHIAEMKPMTLGLWLDPTRDVLFLEILLVLAVVGLVRTLRIDLSALLLAALGLYLTLDTNRFTSAWALMLVPLVVGVWRPAEGAREGWRSPVLATASVVTVIGLLSLSSRAPSFEVDPTFDPGAIEALRALEVRGTVFNDYDHGGYLGWELYGQTRVVVDSRSQMRFTVEEVFEAVQALRDPAIFERLGQLHDFSAVLVPRDSSLCRHLSNQPSWQGAWFSGTRALFLPAGTAAPMVPVLRHLDLCAVPVQSCDSVGSGGGLVDEVRTLLTLTPGEPFLGRLGARLSLECRQPPDLASARAFLAAAVAEPEHPDLLWLSALVLATENPDAALTLLADLPIEHDPGQILRLRLLRRLDRADEALPIARELVVRREDSDISRLRELLAWACEASGDWQCAVREATRAAMTGLPEAQLRLERYLATDRVPKELLPLAGVALLSGGAESGAQEPGAPASDRDQEASSPPR